MTHWARCLGGEGSCRHRFLRDVGQRLGTYDHHYHSSHILCFEILLSTVESFSDVCICLFILTSMPASKSTDIGQSHYFQD